MDNPATELVLAFNQALNDHDLDAMMDKMAENCVFENTYPAPDGQRYEGKMAVRKFWQDFFEGSDRSRIEPEEIFASRDRCVLRWIYYWTDPAGVSGHIRGVDLYKIQAGLIVEKLSYVKG